MEPIMPAIFELEAKEQIQFEQEYEQWCLEVALSQQKYLVRDNSKARDLANQKD